MYMNILIDIDILSSSIVISKHRHHDFNDSTWIVNISKCK